jgi:hypothetical protein
MAAHTDHRHYVLGGSKKYEKHPIQQIVLVTANQSGLMLSGSSVDLTSSFNCFGFGFVLRFGTMKHPNGSSCLVQQHHRQRHRTI